MFTPSEIQRYSRHLLLKEVGLEGQTRLKKASVLLIGAGGLGAPVGQYLAAAGVGRITIVDHDTIDLSNLQRQVVFVTGEVGQSKALVTAKRLSEINPEIDIRAVQERFNIDNAMALVGDADLVIDATDNFATRFLANDACVLAGKPYVYGAIFRFDGQLSVFNYNGSACYRCLFPVPPPQESMPNCAEAGVLGVLPGIIGTLQASEALKVLLGRSDVVAGRLVLFDALATEFRSFSVPRNNDCPVCGKSPTIVSLHESVASCRTATATDTASVEKGSDAVEEIDAQSLKRLLADLAIRFIDVRTVEERSICKIGGTISIPLAEIEAGKISIPTDSQIVVHCKSGARSSRAAIILKKMGYANVRNLKGGIIEWATVVDPTLTKY